MLYIPAIRSRRSKPYVPPMQEILTISLPFPCVLTTVPMWMPPFISLEREKTVDRMDLCTYVGDCYVARHRGNVTAADARSILKKAGDARRILIAGKVTVTAEAAEVFAASQICLLGNEGQTVGPENAPMQVHKILLGRNISLLEGVVLTEIPEGRYFLSAAPLNLAGSDGAPCRAYLAERKTGAD